VWKDPAAIQLFSPFHRVRLPASPVDPVTAALCGPSPAAYLCLKTTSSALAIAAGSPSSELPHSSPLASVLFDGAVACFAPGLRRAGGAPFVVQGGGTSSGGEGPLRSLTWAKPPMA
jgi:hypothetical protein